MARRPQSKGRCAFCGYETSKGAMGKHLASCAQYQAGRSAAEGTKRKSEKLYRLRIEDSYHKQFWFDVEVRGSATLKDLDDYLRAIWLECCGHFSEFSVERWSGNEIAKSRSIDSVFEKNDKLIHLYDFGTTSETKIRRLSTREGVPSNKNPMVLLARNKIPETICADCDQQAEYLCMECVTEYQVWGVRCKKHAEEHEEEHSDYGEQNLLVNSPRLGMCGYAGPAEPLY